MFGEILSFNEFHDENRRAIDLLNAEQRGDARVMQGGKRTCFAPEAGQSLNIIGEFWREKFQGDLSAELRIGRAVDFAHASLAEECCDFIVGEGFAYQTDLPGLL
jgi:hypothetical protein